MSGRCTVRPEHRFPLTCIAVAGASLVAVLLPAPLILRTLIALPLVFILPGEAALRAFRLRFSRAAHVPVAVGTSMAITVLGGLLLDWLGGLTPLGWSLWLGGVSVLAAVVARRGALGPRAALPFPAVRHGIMLAATCAVLALAVLSTVRSTEAYHPFDYTDFWMLPQGSTSDAYLIGIKNGEGRPESYTVQLTVDQRLTGQWRNLVLAPGQGMTLPITVPLGEPAEAWLFRAEQPGVIYRSVTVAGKEAMGAGAEAAAAGGGG